MINKQKIRDELLIQRKNYPFKEKDSFKIIDDLTVELSKYKKIAMYYPIAGEVDIWPLVLKLYSIIDIYLPVSKKNLKFRKFTGPSSLIEGQKNILEPIGEELMNINDLEALVIPAIAINKDGYRLGFGKGLYDRATCSYSGIKIAAIYDFQMIDINFEESHDMKYDIIFTPTKKILIGE